MKRLHPLAGLLLIVAGSGLVIVASCRVRDSIARERIDTYARGYEAGLVDGMRLTTAMDHPCAAPLPPDLSCRSEIADYKRTEAANRENARARGWEVGYRTARGDWRHQPECP